MTPLLEKAIAFALFCWGCAGLAYAINQLAEAQSWRTDDGDDDEPDDDEGEHWKREPKEKHT
jgi:hypothetical protein